VQDMRSPKCVAPQHGLPSVDSVSLLSNSLVHLHHKSTSVHVEIISSSNPAEDSVNYSQLRAVGWDETTSLCQNRDDCHLAKKGTFARHVRARNHRKMSIGTQTQ